MLLIIGLGLDTKDLSVKALEELKDSHSILLDQHTNRIPEEYIRYLELESGKKIRMLARPDLEERIRETIADAKIKKVALLVSGDPFIATTHTIILDAAKKEGIGWKVIHGSSILTAAIGESRLSPYRFGQITTIPFWTESYKPISFIDTIDRNLRVNAHTIVLLDYDYRRAAGLQVKTALECLIKAAKEKGSAISEATMIMALGDVGKESQVLFYSSIKQISILAAGMGEIIFTLVIPAELNFAEKEATHPLES